MKFIELTVRTTSEASELVADVMWEHTAYGVTVCDVNDIIALQRDSTVFWDYMDETLVENPRADVLVKCYLDLDTATQTIAEILAQVRTRQALSAGCIDFGSLEEVKREIEGDDWIDVWKKHFRPIHLGAIVVVPEWIKYEKQPHEEIVLLDSNMAFGTGEHETTSMCVELMQEHLKAGDTVVDVGCGSGILGISALKLGAGKAYLADIDPIAVESSQHNCALNGVSKRAEVVHSDLLQQADVKGDILLANITAEVLLLLAPSIPHNLKKEGVLILSGIIDSRLQAVIDGYSAVGMQVQLHRKKGEWNALVLKWEEV